jgi:uncharacterized protein (DUF1697 family)
MTRWVACLYSVIVGRDVRLTSAHLLEIAAQAGLRGARTVLSSGNLVFEDAAGEPELAARIEAPVAALFGRPVPALLRTADEWQALLAANPFPDEARIAPAQVGLRLLRRPPAPEVLSRIAARALPGERLQVVGRELWLVLPEGMTTSALFRAASAPWAGEGTFRNASAVAKIAADLARG